MVKLLKISSLRLVMFLWLLAFGAGYAIANDNSSDATLGDANSNVVEDVMVYDFEANPELLDGLANNVTSWNAANHHVTISINNYSFVLHNCLQGNGYLSIRGDYKDNDTGDDPGYVSGSMKGTMTKLTIDKNAGSGIIYVLIEAEDGQVKTIQKEVSGKGTVEFTMSGDELIKDAKSITIKTNFRCNIKKISITRQIEKSTSDAPWVYFRTLTSDVSNIKEYRIGKEPTEAVKRGQIVQLVSDGIEGFDPVSAMSNPFVVVYTVNGKNPEFSAEKSGDGKYWKNGNDNDASGNAIGKEGYVYRRGIALNSDGNSVTVKVAIFKVNGVKEDGSVDYVNITPEGEPYTMTFNLDNSTQPTRDNVKFIPTTLTASDATTYDPKMAVLDPTENVTVTETGQDGLSTILAKFSTNDRYDVQSLLNASSVTPAINHKSMKSSSKTMGMRKVSAMIYTQTGLASNMVNEGSYWFVPQRKQLYLKASSTTMTADGVINLNIAKGETTNNHALIAVEAYYKDGDKEVAVDWSKLSLKKENISISDKEVAAIDGDITYSEDKTKAYFNVLGKDNGSALFVVHTEKTNDVTENADNFTTASTSFNVNASGADRMAPPTISPNSMNFDRAFDATITGYEGAVTYYMVHQSGNIMTMAEGDETNNEPTAGDIIEASKNPGTDQTIPYAGIINGAGQQTLRINPTNNGVFTVYAVAEPQQDGVNTEMSHVVKTTYTYTKLNAPTLTPGIEGTSTAYPFDGTLSVEANVEATNAKIYYTVDEDLKFTINSNGTITTNATLFNASTPATISNTAVVRAIAYSEELGIVSNIVTYRYAKKSTDITEPVFYIDGNYEHPYTNGDKYIGDLSQKKVVIKASYYDANGIEQTIGGESVDWNNTLYHIYYTIDGTDISSTSLQYKGAFNIYNAKDNIKITACVYADGELSDGTRGDRSMSDVSVLHTLNSSIAYWETSETNAPNGVLNNRKASITKDGNTLVNIEFGGGKGAQDTDLTWHHYVSKEYATGNPIDNIGKYTITPALDADEEVADVKDEMGNLWNHSKANTQEVGFQTHKATFGLPASGAYVKFEPLQNGTLTIWCCQEGALFYSNKSTDRESFNEGFLRKRPAYFVDEAGRSLKPESVEAAGVLSYNWNTMATPDSWNGLGEDPVNNISQTLYTKKQTANIYNMFNSVILAKGAQLNSPLQPLIVYLNTEENKTVAGFNVTQEPFTKETDDSGKDYIDDPVIDGTGVCLPSASYMKYTFPVKAGKTYFFFGWMTKIGIRGFGFLPDAKAEEATNLTMNSGTTATEKNDFNNYTDKTYNVTLNRTFAANKWTTLVVPFSVSASQLQNVFGEGTKTLHYRTISDGTMYFFEHYHKMIVAGTPILVKPANEVKNPVFKNVTIESNEVSDRPCNDYGFEDITNTDYQMMGSYDPQTVMNGNYYLATDGKVKRLNSKNGSATLGGSRAYIVGSKDGIPVSLYRMAKSTYDNLTPTDMDDETTDIDIIDADGSEDGLFSGSTNDKVVNIDGTVVGSANDGTDGLAKGVYIVKGKKIIVK